MIRKTLLALTATVAVGAAVLTPTAASAWHHHHNHHGLRGLRPGASRLLRRLSRPATGTSIIETRRGLRRILVNVCAY